jgi:hypothetical protein
VLRDEIRFSKETTVSAPPTSEYDFSIYGSHRWCPIILFGMRSLLRGRGSFLFPPPSFTQFFYRVTKELFTIVNEPVGALGPSSLVGCQFAVLIAPKAERLQMFLETLLVVERNGAHQILVGSQTRLVNFGRISAKSREREGFMPKKLELFSNRNVE